MALWGSCYGPGEIRPETQGRLRLSGLEPARPRPGPPPDDARALVGPPHGLGLESLHADGATRRGSVWGGRSHKHDVPFLACSRAPR